ncbi:MAG: Glycerol-3-phosphate transporter [Phycisphaerales bacterium]|nr:Glycerol-3-phosphate transporter [Phycisphaerales bacterium]
MHPSTDPLSNHESGVTDRSALARGQVLVFALTWFAYATYYLGRKGISVCKVDLQDRFGLSKLTLGYIDTGYLAAYACGQFLWGSVGDRLGPRRLVGIGMLCAAAACALFGLSGSAWTFFLAFTLNGLFQSTGWPGTVKAMGTWFEPQRRGAIMGLWGTCYQVGGIVATAFATFFLVRWGWRSAFIGPAVAIAAVGVIVLIFLPNAPKSQETVLAEGEAAGIAQLPESSWAILRSPVIWSLGSAYFCLKLIRYSILFWLPFYLSKVLGYSTGGAGYQSMSFEIGGVIGAVVVGLISDKYFPGRRRQIASVMCAALAASLLLYTRLAPLSVMWNFIGMALVGFCLFGPDTLVCGAAAQDIGGKHNVARAAGFINGLGSIGAACQGRVTAALSAYNWDYLFYTFVALAAVSSVLLLIGKAPRQREMQQP